MRNDLPIIGLVKGLMGRGVLSVQLFSLETQRVFDWYSVVHGEICAAILSVVSYCEAHCTEAFPKEQKIKKM